MIDEQEEWRPHAGAQEAFHSCGAFEVLYGGAAGGGKSESLLIEATRQVNIPTYKAILFRRTYPELETSLILRAFSHYPSFGGTYTTRGHVWTFPSGATIRFGHLEHDKDVHKYQSAEFDFIGFDELTSFTEYQYTYMISRLRGTDSRVERYIRGATNPGNIGHMWVKQRFVENKEPGKVYKDAAGMSKAFIPARVYDNPTLLKNDPQYIERLKLLPEKERRKLLDGDWDAFEGQFFNEWRYDYHVVNPFQIPAGWARYRSIDYGRTNPFCCKWYAVDYDGNVYAYREYYMGGKTAEENAKAIAELSIGETYQYTVADPAIFGKTHLPETIADVLARSGVVCIPGGNDRMSGWNSLREYLKWVELGPGLIKYPRLRYFKTCINSIRTIPQLIHDPHKPEDLDSTGEDHAADVDRYFLQTLRNRKPVKVTEQMDRIRKMMRSEEEGSISSAFYENNV